MYRSFGHSFLNATVVFNFFPLSLKNFILFKTFYSKHFILFKTFLLTLSDQLWKRRWGKNKCIFQTKGLSSCTAHHGVYVLDKKSIWSHQKKSMPSSNLTDTSQEHQWSSRECILMASLEAFLHPLVSCELIDFSKLQWMKALSSLAPSNLQ